MFYIGVDLGQRRDFSALTIVDSEDNRIEPRFQNTPWMQSAYKRPPILVVRHLERIPLGTRYRDVVDRVLEVAKHRDLRTQRRRLVVDATGVGRPVVEMLQDARPGCEIMPVILTAGDQENHTGTAWYVPKVDLMGELQRALEDGHLEISGEANELPTLVRELKDVSMRAGHRRPRIGADGAGEHDDLVTAVALACWSARKTSPKTTARLFW